MNVNKTISAKFEDFFASEYKDEVFEILGNYPDEQSLTVDFQKLEIFDPNLSDLLAEKPEETIETAKIAIKNIDPLLKDSDIEIRFINFWNGSKFEKVNSRYIGEFITMDCIIENVEAVHPVIKNAMFECRGCMRLHEVEQKNINKIMEPSLCHECGGRSFRLLLDDSQYIDSQILNVGLNNTNQKLKLVLMGDLCSYDDFYKGLGMKVVGILKPIKNKKGVFNKYLLVNSFELIENDDLISEELYVDFADDDSRRGSPEYNKWVKNVISDSNNICQCCGGNKHLVAHHIFGYNNHHDYRLNSDNGIALCKWCHGKYHSYYGKDANPRTLIEFLNRFGNSKKELLFSEQSYDYSFDEVSFEKVDNVDIQNKTLDLSSHLDEDPKFKSILKLILSECKHVSTGCSVGSLKEKCVSNGISEEYFDLLIKKLLQRGLVYEYSEGYLKVVR